MYGIRIYYWYKVRIIRGILSGTIQGNCPYKRPNEYWKLLDNLLLKTYKNELIIILMIMRITMIMTMNYRNIETTLNTLH